jgi:uncharacterized membrane protein YcaP (DUF421 family)
VSLAQIAVRGIIAYIYLLVVTRASGKRVVSQATPFDLLVALIIGDLLDNALWAEVSMAKFAGAVGSVMLCDAIVKIGSFHSIGFFHLVNGRPQVVLRDGVEDGDELRRNQLNEGDLQHLMRQKDANDWNDVHIAVLERGAELSVIRKPEAEPATKQDLRR